MSTLDRHRRPRKQSVTATAAHAQPGSHRMLLGWIFGAIVPGIAFAALEIAYANNSTGDGQIATIYVFYIVGFLSFAALRLIFDPITVLILAAVVFVLGLPLGVAVSLGIFAVAPTLFAIGGVVASLAFGLKRKGSYGATS